MVSSLDSYYKISPDGAFIWRKKAEVPAYSGLLNLPSDKYLVINQSYSTTDTNNAVGGIFVMDDSCHNRDSMLLPDLFTSSFSNIDLTITNTIPKPDGGAVIVMTHGNIFSGNIAHISYLSAAIVYDIGPDGSLVNSRLWEQEGKSIYINAATLSPDHHLVLSGMVQTPGTNYVYPFIYKTNLNEQQ